MSALGLAGTEADNEASERGLQKSRLSSVSCAPQREIEVKPSRATSETIRNPFLTFCYTRNILSLSILR